MCFLGIFERAGDLVLPDAALFCNGKIRHRDGDFVLVGVGAAQFVHCKGRGVAPRTTIGLVRMAARNCGRIEGDPARSTDLVLFAIIDTGGLGIDNPMAVGVSLLGNGLGLYRLGADRANAMPASGSGTGCFFIHDPLIGQVSFAEYRFGCHGYQADRANLMAATRLGASRLGIGDPLAGGMLTCGNRFGCRGCRADRADPVVTARPRTSWFGIGDPIAFDVGGERHDFRFGFAALTQACEKSGLCAGRFFCRLPFAKGMLMTARWYQT